MESLIAEKKRKTCLSMSIEIIRKILKSKVQGLGLEQFSEKRMEVKKGKGGRGLC
jgi:hypothetical protein